MFKKFFAALFKAIADRDRLTAKVRELDAALQVARQEILSVDSENEFLEREVEQCNETILRLTDTHATEIHSFESRIRELETQLEIANGKIAIVDNYCNELTAVIGRNHARVMQETALIGTK